MTNISFNELKTYKKDATIIKTTTSGKEIEVIPYLPVNEKLALITRVLQLTANNDYNFVNPVQLDIYTALEIVYAYSNIEFTEEEKADPPALYDELEQEGIINLIISAIPKTEYNFVVDGVEKTISAYYTYKNSALGILETISQDYSNLNLEADDIKNKIGDPNNLALLKDIVQKLG